MRIYRSFAMDTRDETPDFFVSIHDERDAYAFFEQCIYLASCSGQRDSFTPVFISDESLNTLSKEIPIRSTIFPGIDMIQKDQN